MKIKYITFLFVTGYIGTAEAGSHPEILACKKINREFKGATCDILKGGDLIMRIDYTRPVKDVSSDERLFIGNLQKQFLSNNNGGPRFYTLETSPESRAANMVRLCHKKNAVRPEVCEAQKLSDYTDMSNLSIFRGGK